MSETANKFDFGKDYLAEGETVRKVIVEANAGTGKTFSIENLYCQLLTKHEKKIPIERILVVTFTDAATAELKKRLRERLVKTAENSEEEEDVRNAARKALASFDLAPIFTIHGFCRRALEDFAFESGADLDAEMGDDDTALLAETVRDYYNRSVESGGSPGKLSDLISFAKEVFRLPRAELVPDIRGMTEESVKAKGAALVEAVKNAPLPSRDSGFKNALVLAKSKIAEGSQNVLDEILALSELFGDTAKKNAQAIVKAGTDCRSVKQMFEKAELLKHLEDPVRGFLARKARTNKMSFDDLLKKMDDALSGNGAETFADALRKAYDVAIVDEFQDTDPLQYNIFNSVFGKVSADGERKLFFMMGDPKQAIYSFRGGDLATYRRASESVTEDGGERSGLYANYRSSESVIDAVNKLFSEASSPGRRAFLEDGIVYTGSECGLKDTPQKLKSRLSYKGAPLERPFKLLWMTGKKDKNGPIEPVNKTGATDLFFTRTADEIVAMLNDSDYRISREGGEWERLRPKDFAVLVEVNWECQEIRRKLKRRGVPAVVLKSGNVFASKDANDLAFILEAMLKPEKTKYVKAAFLTPWCGKSPADVAKADDKSMETDIAKFVELGDIWRKRGIAAAMSGFLAKFDALANIAKDPDCERRMVNERHLLELLHKQEQEGSLEPEGTLKYLHDCMTEAGNNGGNDPEGHEERLESDEDAVTIMTVFKSKGLEFPIVFCPTVSTGYYPVTEDRMSRVHRTDENGSAIVFPVGKEAKNKYLESARLESFGEKIRLLYVALTRASCASVILGGNVNQKGNGFATAFHYLLFRRDNPTRPETEMKSAVLQMGSPSIESIRDIVAVEEALDDDYVKDEDEPKRYTPEDGGADGEGSVRHACEAPTVTNEFAVMSYSGMVDHTYVAAAAERSETDQEIEDKEKDPLPGGTATGLAVHKVFEDVDYRDGSNWNTAIEKALRDNGLADAEGETVRRDRMRELVEKTLAAELPGCGFSLDTVGTEDTKREWKFFSAVKKKPDLEPFKELGLSFKPDAAGRSGCLTGEIDLIFRKDGKYYFADWKTDRLDDYSRGTLEDEMKKRGYLFQAYIYAIALRDLLIQRMGENFNFSKHFGGGFYCFVRGVGDGNGICPFTPTEEELVRYQICFGREAKDVRQH